MKNNTDTLTQIPEPSLSRFLFADTRMNIFWTLLRVWLGWTWLTAGWGKLTNPAGVWVGDKAGTALTGFLQGALTKTDGDHPEVSGWYASFIQNVALPNATFFSFMVAYGELFVGTALILGLFTGIAAFFGGVMNANFLFAGTLSTNPLLLIAAVGLMLAWRVAGQWGLDRILLPLIGVPGAPGKLFEPPASKPKTPAV
ncbi:DoxX family protein [Deinococcus roseus]|uniref:DoxX family protein n=1 Tax=Deinococcus roseus TaxID=392414 RepID=A0ABQ2DIQ4_9DEIO|nr:DoxX family protein [Deinococcus roseus]GGJ59468.1 hypothetical protein GCM10008938_52030 [Deinococcus roseus]